jgi:hypothetical protein
MLETLAGRLKWEETSEGIVVSVPVRRGVSAPLYGPLVAIWLIYAAVHYWNLLGTPHRDYNEFTLQVIAIAIYAFGFCFAVFWLTWIFTAETILTLTPSEMKIQRRVAGIVLTTQSFETRHVRNLKYIPPSRFWALEGYTDPGTANMQFKVGNETHSFGKGITEAEARALAARMLKVYEFPHSQTPVLVQALQ